MQPLYDEATAFQHNRDRAAAAPYRFIALDQRFDRYGRVSGRVAEFTPLGVVRPLSAQISGRHVAVDPRGTQTFYGELTRNLVSRFDPLTGAATELRPIEWLTGLTFDTRRNRLVASNLSGEGFLFTYSPDTNRWATLRSLNNVDMFSTTYSANDDALYSLTGHYGGPLRLLRYNAETGLPAGTINLSEPIDYTDLWDYQLTATGDRLSLITSPIPDLYKPHLPPMPRSYLIDPSTGAVTYIGVIPEPATGLLLTCAVTLMTLRRRH